MTLKHLLDLFRSHFPEKIAWKLGTEEQHRSCGLVRFHSNLSVVIGQCNSWWHSCWESRLLILLSSVHQRCSYFLCLVPLIKTINHQMPFMCTMTLPSSNKERLICDCVTISGSKDPWWSPNHQSSISHERLRINPSSLQQSLFVKFQDSMFTYIYSILLNPMLMIKC